MPTWILTLIGDIGPITSTLAGLEKIFAAITAEIKSSDGTEVQIEKILADLAAAATEIDQALTANT